ncbi:MAG: DUF262 domain-containing protein [Cytophagia bacterium]|nr:MAG: DUF262 domain-containing protein [Cytophagia bacterium]
MDYQKYDLKELIEKSASQNLVLPNFQRDFVWKPEQQRLLLASLLVDLPIGNFLILEGTKGDFNSKELCFQKKQAEPSENCLYLLDGQQRLSTIRSIFSDLLGIEFWETNFDALYYPLRNLWYIDLKEDEFDHFGYKTLRFKKLDNGKQTILRTLEPTDILECLKYNQLHKTIKDRFFHPGQRFAGNSLFEKQFELAEKYAKDDKIPLFDVFTNSREVVKQTLTLLSNYKGGTLQSNCKQNPDKSFEILGHLDSTITQKYKDALQNSTDPLENMNISNLWTRLKTMWVEDVLDYFKDLFRSDIMVPTIKANELSRATSVFEYMNKGGTPLDTFDIMVAKHAQVGEEKTLYDYLEDALVADINIPQGLSDTQEQIIYKCEHFKTFNDGVIIKPVKELFLNFLCLINRLKVNSEDSLKDSDIEYIKKEKILKMTRDNTENALKDALKALQRSMAFLQFRCGVDTYNSISYNLMLIPIGLVLKDDVNWNNPFVHKKVEYWYWTSLFSGRFREKQNQRCIIEARFLQTWIADNNYDEIIKRQNNLFNETNYCDEQTLMLENEDKSVPKAIHNSILQYVISLRPQDFTESTEILRVWELAKDGKSIQDHHIIPLGSTTKLGESTKEIRKKKDHILNSPLNRTYISQEANNKISSMELKKYLPFLHQMVSFNHCLGPINEVTEFKDDIEFYKKFAKNRFNAIKQQLTNELSTLKQ